MLGLIFFQLKHFVIHTYNLEVWEQTLKEAGVEHQSYESQQAYSDKELLSILTVLSSMIKKSIPELEEAFGEFIAPSLYRTVAHKIDPNWSLADFFLNTEEVIHASIKKSMVHSTTPFLKTKKISDKEVEIIYTSSRKMCDLAKGLIKGLATVYHKNVVIFEPECMHKGSPHCLLKIKIEDLKKIKSRSL